MHVKERRPGDMPELKQMACAERGALQRDKYRAVVQAMSGREAPDIARALGRSRRAVQGWVYPYRDDGIDAPVPGRSTRRPTKLTRDLSLSAVEGEALFLPRLAGGPTEADGGVRTLRGLPFDDAQGAVRILATEFRRRTRSTGRTTSCTGWGTRA